MTLRRRLFGTISEHGRRCDVMKGIEDEFLSRKMLIDGQRSGIEHLSFAH